MDETDEHERDLRLVSLTYEVLRDVEMPAGEATDAAVLLHLSRAFADKAAALAAPRGGRKPLPGNSDPYLLA
jgi:hypothetical protein